MTTLTTDDRTQALAQFRAVRQRTEALARPLHAEDLTVQSMPDASPGKWHLAHTTWFFETFVLKAAPRPWASPDPAFTVLFNSYYQSVGPQWARAARGALSRPTVEQVWSWREAVDAGVGRLIETVGEAEWRTLAPLIEVGLNHEEQHQELFCTDLRHAFALNPQHPAAYPSGPTPSETAPSSAARPPPMRYREGREGVVEIGADGRCFTFDNEGPRHKVVLVPHAIADRLVTNGEYQAFIEDRGYQDPLLWLSDGWDKVQSEGWAHPLYWRKSEDGWIELTLHGPEPLDSAAPVNGLSAFEALAFAAWAKARLPTEAEWEALSGGEADAQTTGLLTRPRIHPMASGRTDGLRQRFGEVWQWTQSPYSPYPGFQPNKGALGEYNAKFMVNQLVLRGGSCATPPGHSRGTYRNFFPPSARWQFAGIRLARDL